MMHIEYTSIGTIHSPYSGKAARQAVEEDEGFFLELMPRYESALNGLICGSYIIVLFHMDRTGGYDGSNLAYPPHMHGASTGLFASRSPNRPNPIGLDVARIIRISGRRVYTSGLSALDGSPILDVKPYISQDSKPLKR